MNAVDALLAERIVLRDFSCGTRKTTCPKCSASRRNKTERCLSVTITGPEDVVWHCHHCAWSGGFNARFSDMPKPPPPKNKGVEWRKKFTSERRW